jgi:hypothetical protein
MKPSYDQEEDLLCKTYLLQVMISMMKIDGYTFIYVYCLNDAPATLQKSIEQTLSDVSHFVK